MKVYLYDSANIYTAQHICEQDPLDIKNHLMPANATTTPPPAVADNQAAVWTGEAWEVKADYRNEQAYSIKDGSEVQIQELGELPEDVTLTPCLSRYHSFVKGKWTITKADAARKKADEAKAHNQQIYTQIDALEQKQKRPLREAALATAEADRDAALARIKQLDEQINELRKQLKK